MTMKVACCGKLEHALVTNKDIAIAGGKYKENSMEFRNFRL